MKATEKKFVRVTLEELDRHGWEPPNLRKYPQKQKNAAKSTPVLLRLVTPILDAIMPAKNADF